MKTSSKTSKPSTGKEKKTKDTERSEESYKWIDQFKDLRLLKFKPVTKEYLERLGTGFVEWAREQEAEKLYDERKIVVMDYFSQFGICDTTIRGWFKISPDFEQQYLLGKKLLGARRERAAFFKKADATIFLKSAATYDPEWERLEEWRSRLAKLEQQQEEILLKLESYKVDDKGNKTPL